MSKEKKQFQAPRGLRDILPSDQLYWQYFRQKAESTLSGLGINRIDIPHFETTEIFQRAIGDESDVIKKEMYHLASFSDDDKDKSFSLRPEGTAGVVRSFIQNGMNSWPQPVKLYYLGAMFRHDRPQKGRFREFYQLGVEIFGDSSPKSDYLCIMSAWEILSKIGLKDLIIHINSIGCPKCRPKYVAKLKKFFKSNIKKLCPDCLVRLDNNPMRVLDCKQESCRKIAEKAPISVDNLCEACKNHFQVTLEYLDYFGIRYDLAPTLVRGLDYYTRTVFEITEANDTLRQSSLGGGGRYDELVEMLGGAKTSAVGYSLGIDRIVALMKERNITPPKTRCVEVVILQLGEKAKDVSKSIYEKLSENDINVYFVPSNDTLRTQIRGAAKLGARYAIIIGQKEAFKEEVILRDLKASAQETIPTCQIVEQLKKRI